MTQNEPLLFVHGPPVFIRVEVLDEESTSVFVPVMENEEDVSNIELEVHEEQDVQEVQLESKEVNPSVARRVTYLQGAFQKQVYRPLEFHTSKEIIKGTIEKVEGDTLYVEREGEETAKVEMKEILEIFWRGKPFAEE